jgi:hypothetical protein
MIPANDLSGVNADPGQVVFLALPGFLLPTLVVPFISLQ